MDESTKIFLSEIKDNVLITENINKINKIYDNFKTYEGNTLTIDVVREIFNKINQEFYNGKFYSYLEAAPKRSSKLNFRDNKKQCKNATSIFEVTEYYFWHKQYYKGHSFGFNVALTCLNSILEEKIYYSGGYITKSKVIFIILMLLHESIHIIEFKDSYLTKAWVSHRVLFYKLGFKHFNIISRLSEFIEDESLLNFEQDERIELIEKLFSNNSNAFNASDGVPLLNDHSHYIDDSGNEKPLGYIVHKKFKDDASGKLLFVEDFAPSQIKTEETQIQRQSQSEPLSNDSVVGELLGETLTFKNVKVGGRMRALTQKTKRRKNSKKIIKRRKTIKSKNKK
jgi:hypothetical protein